MVIQSKFRDYYDHMAHQYGGGDPKIVYARGRIKAQFVEMTKCVLPDSSEIRNRYSTNEDPCDFAYLVVAAKPYLLTRSSREYFDGLNGFKIVDADALNLNLSWWRRTDWSFIGHEDASLIELSRRVEAPVFVVRRVQVGWRNECHVHLSIDERCPILQSLGMASLIPTKQMYQDLAYFMGNTMHPSPDTQPPVEVSNRNKILAAGFDLKQSFRHRLPQNR